MNFFFSYSIICCLQENHFRSKEKYVKSEWIEKQSMEIVNKRKWDGYTNSRKQTLKS